MTLNKPGGSHDTFRSRFARLRQWRRRSCVVDLSDASGQAERYPKAIAQQTRAARLVDWQLGLADPALQEVLNKGQDGDDDIALGQLRQYGSLFRAGMFNGEDTFILHKAGLISDDVFDAYYGNLRTVCARAGWRAMWKEQRDAGGKEFREFVNRIVAETPISAPVDELATWRAAVGAERGKAAN